MLVMMANSGRRTRSEWGYKINSLIHAQMMNEVAARDQQERINMLIQSQMETSQEIKSVQRETSEQIKSLQSETSEQIKGLASAQAKTDEALRAFINSLRKGHNGRS
jgi:hypothetical protein